MLTLSCLIKNFGISLNLFFRTRGGGGLENSDIFLVHNNAIVTDEQELTEIFNDHYINLVEKSSGKKPTSLAKDTGISDDRQIVRLIIEKYKNHPSILTIIQNPEQ